MYIHMSVCIYIYIYIYTFVRRVAESEKGDPANKAHIYIYT